jgi:hypothetical protein
MNGTAIAILHDDDDDERPKAFQTSRTQKMEACFLGFVFIHESHGDRNHVSRIYNKAIKGLRKLLILEGPKGQSA